MKRFFGAAIEGVGLGLLFAAIVGPISNLLIWSVAERWYFPHALPLTFGFSYWQKVFSPTGDAVASLEISVVIAILVVGLCLVLAVPAGYALARLPLPFRSFVMLTFLVPQAFPEVSVYMNVARMFYMFRLNGTVPGVVLVHVVHGLVYSVWITTAAFAAVDRTLEEAARGLGASPLRTFLTITLPLAAGGIIASSIFVFVQSIDEFTGTFFVGVPDIVTLPMLLYAASSMGNYQIASITALILLVPSVLFMVIVQRFLRADVLGKIGL